MWVLVSICASSVESKQHENEVVRKSVRKKYQVVRKELGNNVRMLGKWLGVTVRKIKGCFLRCTKRKKP